MDGSVVGCLLEAPNPANVSHVKSNEGASPEEELYDKGENEEVKESVYGVKTSFRADTICNIMEVILSVGFNIELGYIYRSWT